MTIQRSDWQLTPELLLAMRYAAEKHSQQWRGKGGTVATPYLAHPWVCAGLVMEDGGTTAQTIAALCHDIPEDQGGREALAEIRTLFGDDVADIVAACSDTFDKPKPPWIERKEAHLLALAHEPFRDVEGVFRVTLADKLHNIRELTCDYERQGQSLWAGFRGGKAGSLWFFGRVIEIARERGVRSFLLDELAREFTRLRVLVRANEDAGADSAR